MNYAKTITIATCGLCCLGSPGGVVAGLLTPGGAGFTKGLSGVVVGVDGALLGLGIRGIPGFNCGLKWNCSYINNCNYVVDNFNVGREEFENF